VIMLLFEVVMMICYGLCVDYKADATTINNQVLQHYGKFQDVHVMIFIGFGFLMTFLKKYGFSSVGFNFLISAVTIQLSILTNAFWHNVFKNHWAAIDMNITSLITGDFAAGAVMISFGAMLGKASPLELVFVAIMEMIVYGCNECIGVIEYKAVDMGGSIFVHTFGAYFGLACSWMITKKDENGKVLNEDDEGSTHTSDMFAMIGTIFLWMFWPSFNGALATGTQQHRVIINTVLALTGSCIITFVMSAMFRHEHKFDMVDIQNATLAGGVAVGSASDLVIGPWGAILIGCIGGTVSTLGYVYLQPCLYEKIGLHDTCGVHNLHGMPGVIGGIGGAISAAVAGDNAYGEPISAIYAARGAKTTLNPDGEDRSAGSQCGFQLAATFTAMGLAIFGGALTGFIINMNRNCIDGGHTNYFHDADYWECADKIDDKVDTFAIVDSQDNAVVDIPMDDQPKEGAKAEGDAPAEGEGGQEPPAPEGAEGGESRIC